MKKRVDALGLFSICVILEAVSGCVTAAKAPSHGSQNVGWLDGKCLAIKRSGLAPGTAVSVVELDKPQRRIEATIGEPATEACQCDALMPDRQAVNTSNNNTFYKISTDKPIGLGILLLRRQDSDAMTLSDLNRDGSADTYAY